MKINKTTEHGKFAFADDNRNIDESHVRKLKRSIKENNLLEVTPIIVDENYTVIDGQHRLQAATELGVPIYYVVNKESGFETMTTLNTTSKNWNLLDFARSYDSKGLSSYGFVLKLCEELRMNVSTALRLLLNQSSVHDRKEKDDSPTAIFKEGKLKVGLKEYMVAKEIGLRITRLSDYVPSCRTGRFVMTMMRLFKNDKFCIARFEEQLRKYDVLVQSRSTVKDYLRDIEDIYNMGKHEKNRVRLYE